RSIKMIFVSVGSRDYQFDRLIKELDRIVDEGIISDEIFAQIGKSNYEPQYFNYERFLSHEELAYYQDKEDIVISNAGTGSLVGALKKRKKVIAVPRLEEYGEHIDNHQLQVASVLEKEKYLLTVTDISNLGKAITNLKSNKAEVKLYEKPSFVF